VDRLYKRGGINGHSSETCSNGLWPTATVEHRSEIDSAAGVTDRRAFGGNLSEVCGECSAIDLPVRERKIAIRELSYMGITVGSLFSGPDGACRELNERFFVLGKKEEFWPP